ncbi:MAG: hypothetical protein LBL13_04530 [Bacteroidales bacterium]|jgi:hypothetical protein|nr:hypothetical protein [Bacteroidales bacterium]
MPITKDGAILYNAKAHELKPVAKRDHRPSIVDRQTSIVLLMIQFVKKTVQYRRKIT